MQMTLPSTLIPRNNYNLSSIIDSFSNTCSTFGLNISVNMTVIMSLGTQVAKITLSDEALEIMENFSYVVSIMSNNVTLDKELNTQGT